MVRLFKRGKAWYVRGTVNGRGIYRATGTTDRTLAEEILRNIEGSALIEKEWRPVPGHPLYQVSRDGRIRRKPVELGQSPSRYGYPLVQLSNGKGKPVWMLVHRAVALAYLGPAPDGKPQVCHRDGDKWNRHVSNLYWGSAAENGRDKARHNAERKAKSSEKTVDVTCSPPKISAKKALEEIRKRKKLQMLKTLEVIHENR